eukprot:CAMPEP_0182422652 /NCGR_PEP_ID=MMETSP1167-20130531/8396_1 /TAXON_ID=2988 /ORGANISM="Mallomonas Sp, Strain CCMP3275" /LENGTH=240 /DNA_ID=CAMNT_0024600887 /DNA_START=37 /DNA_END=759 /DNA_ORIENTATION=-
MALVNVTDVVVLDNPSAFTNPFQFEITFECLQELQDDLEWKIVYVGSAESQEYDQVLEEVVVGPVLYGVNKFVLTSAAPNHLAIPDGDILGVTVILLSCSYMDNKFIQIGYYVNSEYSEEYDPENPPNPIDISKVFRNILADEPRVTRFPIDWSGGNSSFPDAPPVQSETAEAADAENEVDMVNDLEGEDEEEEEEEEEEGEEGDIEVDIEQEERDENNNKISNEDSMDVEQMNKDISAF